MNNTCHATMAHHGGLLWRQGMRLAMLMLCFLLLGCGSELTPKANVTPKSDLLYIGPPYGDFAEVMRRVYDCMAVKPTIGHSIAIYSGEVWCYGIEVGGCVDYANAQIVMVGPMKSISGTSNNLIDTQGALYSHELCHWILCEEQKVCDELTHKYHNHWCYQKCGTIRKEGFQL